MKTSIFRTIALSLLVYGSVTTQVTANSDTQCKDLGDDIVVLDLNRVVSPAYVNAGPVNITVCGLDAGMVYRAQIIKKSATIEPLSLKYASPSAGKEEAQRAAPSPWPLRVITLDAGDEISITIQRRRRDQPVSSYETVVDKFVVKAKLGSKWLTGIGFMFIDSHDKRYFSAAGGKDMFTITRKADHGGWDFAPAVVFSWLPDVLSYHSGVARGGLSVGLGLDSDVSNPNVFGGLSLTVGQNATAMIGVVMHKEQRLKGQYREGQVIKENIAEGDLTEGVYKARFFVGLSLVLKSNPFKSK